MFCIQYLNSISHCFVEYRERTRMFPYVNTASCVNCEGLYTHVTILMTSLQFNGLLGSDVTCGCPTTSLLKQCDLNLHRREDLKSRNELEVVDINIRIR
jgi:hypothetical protein